MLAREAEEFGLSERLLSLLENSPIAAREEDIIEDVTRLSRMRGSATCRMGDCAFDSGDTSVGLAGYIADLQEWLGSEGDPPA